MTELVETSEALDSYVRERVENVLLGKHSNNPRYLHLPLDTNPAETVCPKRTYYGTPWIEKPLNIYPPGFHKICRDCAERKFGIEVRFK